jgi:mono/diheme cytochrome c family protein
MSRNGNPSRAAAVLFTLMVSGAAGAAPTVSPAVASDAPGAAERGQMLYENHCRGCHVSVVHIRSNRRAVSLEAVRWEVARWSGELQLDWRKEEIADVVEYLDQAFYKLALPGEPNRQAEPDDRAGDAGSDGN